MTRTIRFFDGNYICCSTYGKPRSKDFHWKYFKQLLQENDLPDIRWHDLRATYCTILLKNDFNPKAVSKMMGHANKSIFYNMKTYYKAHTQKDNGLAGCMECGQCENICPQKISIRKYFGEIKQLFE